MPPGRCRRCLRIWSASRAWSRPARWTAWVDATRCGGNTSWLRASAVAGAQGLDVSARCAPNLHAHVGVSVPHLRRTVYFLDHHSIETLFFDGR